MGPGIGALLVLVAACLASALSCTSASSRKLDLTTMQSCGPLFASSQFAFDPSKSKRLSWHPRVFLYKGFLSDMECDHLISMAHGKMESSLVVAAGATSSSQNNTDESIKMYMADSKDTIVSKIEDRISIWSFLPKDFGESMQILKYEVNKSGYNNYGSQSSSGNDRLVTVLIYLSDVKRGGETVFPRSEGTQVEQGAASECVGYAVQPVKGNAILLFNLKPDGVIDMDSQYEVCSVLEGEEWLALKHIHLKKTDTPKSSLASEDECTDEDARCVSWAAGGECDTNPLFMIGSPDYYGTCRKSCRVC